MSTLVNEPLLEQVETDLSETEQLDIEVVDEAVSAEISSDTDELLEDTEEILEKNAEASAESDDLEPKADVIALKPEDLADIKNKVDSGSDETIATQLEAGQIEVEQDDLTEDVADEDIEKIGLNEAANAEVENVEVVDADAEIVEVDTVEADTVEAAELEAEVDTATAQVEENTETGDAIVDDEAGLAALAGESAEEEADEEELSEDGDEAAKPSRSRALLLTSLLSTTKPISKKELKKVLKLPEKEVLAAIEDLKTVLYEQDLGLMMEEVAGGYRVIIQPNLYTDLAELISPPPLPQLSSAALETLAIISYKQPITRGELEAARGTGCSSTLDTLQERDLIKILGQKDVVGKPLLYGTTERFLLEFGLKSLEDLPPLDEKPTEFLRS